PHFRLFRSGHEVSSIRNPSQERNSGESQLFPRMASRPEVPAPARLRRPRRSPGRSGFAMTRTQLRDCTRKQLVELARQHGIPGRHAMRKVELIDAPAAQHRKDRRKRNPAPRLVAPVQPAAARNTSGNPEESKFDVGAPTRDLAARTPRDLPAGYGKDR